MPDNTPTDNKGSAPMGAVWLSAREAAAALGVSEKTVWRRAKAGKLTSRKVASDSGGLVWEVSLEPTGQRPDKPKFSTDILKGQTEILNGHSERTNEDSRRTSERTSGDSQRTSERTKASFERDLKGHSERTATGQTDILKGHLTGQTKILKGHLKGQNNDTEARFMAHLETENAFLRTTIEQLQRDGAEVRAALRAALKLVAPQETPQLTEPPTTGAASSGAPDREPFKPPDPTTGDKSGAALTYGDIANQLERDLKARGL